MLVAGAYSWHHKRTTFVIEPSVQTAQPYQRNLVVLSISLQNAKLNDNSATHCRPLMGNY